VIEKIARERSRCAPECAKLELRKELKLSTVEVEVVGEGAEIVGVVEKAIEIRKDRIKDSKSSIKVAEYDEIWCVVDAERKIDNPSWERGIDRSSANELLLAWSNPCFEYWILLHFERIGRSFDGYHDVRNNLKKYITDYQKNLNYFDKLAPRISIAIDRSKEIHRTQWKNTPKIIDKNPATTVHELVESLFKIAEITVDQFLERYAKERSR
jgi:hypothetical protein